MATNLSCSSKKFFLTIGVLCVSSLLLMGNSDSLKLRGNFFRKKFSVSHAIVKSSYQVSKIIRKKKVKERNKQLKLKGYRLVFEDQFDSLNTKIWRVGQPWGRFNPGAMHQYYGYDQVKTRSGKLYLTNEYAPKKFNHGDSQVTIPYAVGLINSDISFTPKYGYFEISCRMPEAPATWCAFWLTGKYHWPPEIDIFENYGGVSGSKVNRPTQSIHWGVSGKETRGYITRSAKIYPKKDTSFHIYGCEWTPKTIRFYTDGKLIRYQRVNNKMNAWLNEEMTIILNNGLESKYLPKNYSSYITSHMIVDYLKVYQRNDPEAKAP